MVNAQFTEADVAQIPVVLREMEMAQSSPMVALSQQLLAPGDPHGYGRHPLGTREEVEKLTLQGARNFYQTHYQPQNAILVLTGKFDAKKTLTQVQQYFGSIQGVANSVTQSTTQQKPSSAKRIDPQQISVKDGETPMAVLAYSIPAAVHPVGAEFAVISDVLVGKPHGRLYQTLVVPGKATDVLASPQSLREAGMFFLTAVLSANQSSAEVQKLMVDTIEQLSKQPITEQELQRAQVDVHHFRTQVQADPVLLGAMLAENSALGDWRLFFQQTDRVARLNVADIQQAAARYLKSGMQKAGEVLAEEAASEVSRPVAPLAAQPLPVVASTVSGKPVTLSSALAVKDSDIEKLEAQIQRFTLSSGLKVALFPQPGSGQRVQGHLYLRFDENRLFGKRQISDLTAVMLTYGTRQSSQQQLVDRMAAWGAQMGVVPDNDHVSVRFEVPPTALLGVLGVVTEVLREPTFPSAEFDVVRRLMKNNLTHQRNEPEVLAREELTRRSTSFSVGDVRRAPSREEALANLAQITREDLVRFHANFYAANLGELAMVGDFDAEEVRQNLERLLGSWKSEAEPVRLPRPFQVPQPGTFAVSAAGKAHGQYLGLLRLPVRDDAKDVIPLMLANQILGGMPVGSRLTERLRNQEGLSYRAGAQIRFSIFEDNGSLTLSASYPPERREQVKSVMHEELVRLVQEGITTQELQQAQETLLQQSRQSRSQNGNIMALLPKQLRAGKTMQFLAQREAEIANASVEEVNAAVRRYFDPAQLLHILADAGVSSVTP